MLAIIDVPATGERIAELMALNKISSSEIADVMGFTSATAVNRWKKGASCPSIDHLVMLASLFGVKVDDVIRVRWEEV